MEWGIMARGGGGVACLEAYTAYVYTAIQLRIYGNIIFICRFSSYFAFSLMFRGFFKDSHCTFLLLLPLLANCVCVCAYVCVGVSCCYCCNSLNFRRAGRLLGKE